MSINNQSKARQLSNKRASPLHILKKIKSKDSLTSKEHKAINKLAPSRNNQNKQQKAECHIQFVNKSKDKSKQTKNIYQQYYVWEKKADKSKRQTKQNNKQPNHKNQLGKLKQQKSKCEDDEHDNKMPKLKLNQNKVVINFNGKMVKLPQKSAQAKGRRNYNSMSSSDYALTDREFTNNKTKKKKNKSKSKHKYKDTKGSRSKSKSDLKKSSSTKHYISNEIYERTQYESNKISQKMQQTQVSPIQNKQYLRTELFDYEQIQQLIQQEILSSKQIKIPTNLSICRKQSIRLMSQICGQVKLRRQTFYLAISIFDRAISKQINTINYGLLTLVSLTLAMKLQQPKLANQFMYVLGVVSSSHSTFTNSAKSSSQSKYKSHSKSKGNKIRIKQQNIRQISTSGLAKILSRSECSKICANQFGDLQRKVTIYLRFKLWRIQAIYWTDLLTCMWDQHILKKYPQHKESLLFRHPHFLGTLSNLYQVLQLAYLDVEIYNRPSIYIVLSVMYLLVRIVRENSQNGFQYYRKGLSTSSNILFVDTMKVNQVFWGFLQKIKVEMVQILGCAQFVSRFLQQKIKKGSLEEESETNQWNLCVHEYNQSLYKGEY